MDNSEFEPLDPRATAEGKQGNDYRKVLLDREKEWEEVLLFKTLRKGPKPSPNVWLHDLMMARLEEEPSLEEEKALPAWNRAITKLGSLLNTDPSSTPIQRPCGVRYKTQTRLYR